MDVRFSCHKCEQHIDAPEEMAGQRVNCPGCQQALTVPDRSTIPTESKLETKDISFDCFKCGQNIVIDEAGAGQLVDCPQCNQSLTVPLASSQAISGVPSQPTSSPPGYSPEILNPMVEISLWKPDSIWFLFLSPVFGSAILRANYKTLGKTKEAKRSAVWFGIGLTLLVLNLFLPVGGIFWLYFVVWYFMDCRPQVKLVKKELNDRYTKKKWDKPLLLWLCGLIGYVIVAMIVVAIRGN